MSNLPIRPMLFEAEIDRESRIRDLYTGVTYPYEGEIKPGMIFAWEPDLPTARELVIVTHVVARNKSHNLVYSKDFPARSREVWNDESRFREAVFATILNPQPVE